MAAVCPKCSEVRARSRHEFERGTPVKPMRAEDYLPLGDQPQPVEGQRAACIVCDTDLIIRAMPAANANGAPPSMQDHSTPVPDPPASAAVTTHFAVVQGEEVRDMRALGTDRLLVVTNRRIVTINLNAIAEEMP